VSVEHGKQWGYRKHVGAEALLATHRDVVSRAQTTSP
jgi:hypothetical protein